MDQKLAVLFMPDDMTLTKEQTPLMLRPILFCPILTWMVEELMGRGIERFFIVSDKRVHDMMRPYVPENADVVYVDGARHGEELLTLLNAETRHDHLEPGAREQDAGLDKIRGNCRRKVARDGHNDRQEGGRQRHTDGGRTRGRSRGDRRIDNQTRTMISKKKQHIY